MKITWLGQAGLLFETGNNKIIIDPYLSNSCFKLNPASDRRMPVDETYLKIKPDVLILTHDHLDHTDPETLEHYLGKNQGVLVLASQTAWNHVRTIATGHNFVMFNRHTQWTFGNVKFSAVKAEHSDVNAIGVIIEAEGKKYYITGDTLYNTDIFSDLPDDIDAIFLPVNGVGNNLNMIDAAKFAKETGAKKVVPLHFGLFDSLDPEKGFVCENKVIPTIYKEIEL